MQPFRYFADISNNNGRVDLAAYRKAGHRLIGVKATEGETFIDPSHSVACKEAHAHGVAVLHYHYCRPDNHPHTSAEAAAFWRAVRPLYAPGDILCFDLEVRHPEGPTACGRYLDRLVGQLRRISGHTCVGYSYESFLLNDLAGDSVPGKRWWVAAYQQNAPSAGRGRRRWAWQRTDGAVGPEPHSLPGIGKCDVSVLNLASALRLVVRPAKPGRARAGG